MMTVCGQLINFADTHSGTRRLQQLSTHHHIVQINQIFCISTQINSYLCALGHEINTIRTWTNKPIQYQCG